MRVAGPNPNTAYARSSALSRRSNVLVSKSGCTSIRRPPESTTASPQLGSCCVGDFLAANSTGTNRPAEEALLLFLFQRCFFRCRFSVPKLKPRLRQNSVRRMPLLINSATSCWTSVRVRRRRVDIFCFPFIQLLHHTRFSSKRCVAKTLTVEITSSLRFWWDVDPPAFGQCLDGGNRRIPSLQCRAVLQRDSGCELGTAVAYELVVQGDCRHGDTHVPSTD